MKIRRTKNFRNLEHALLIPPNWRGKLIKAFLQWKFRICFIRMKLGINNHTTVKGKRIVKICQVEIIKKIRKIWKKTNIVGTTISFFFFCFFALRETEVEKSGKKNLWRIQNRRIPWTGYPRSLFNRLLIVIRRASHRSAFVHIGQAWRWPRGEISLDPHEKNTGSPPRNPFQLSKDLEARALIVFGPWILIPSLGEFLISRIDKLTFQSFQGQIS